ncbi:GTP-binding nuclear protein Ran [Cladobotryum mycophilum]|uniref:GTP-binding nuclear protein n=1 Tax=Cladobotryum mycophilum TaxID=491253 RepID=A0ABR0SR72_9HYPO
MAEAPKQFELIVVGDPGVGKTTFINSHVSGESNKRHVPTIGAEVSPLHFSTNYGEIVFTTRDITDPEKLADGRGNFYTGAECAIIMFDVSSSTTYENVSVWYRDVTGACPNIPIILCGNKVDVANRQVKPRDIYFHRHYAMQYYNVSTRSMFNIEKVFLWLSQILTTKNDLTFIGDHFNASTITVDTAEIEKEPAEALQSRVSDDEEF